jgi:serine/threonine-protein kinase RsbW
MTATENQKLTFKSVAENITLVESLVDNICEEFKINEDSYGNILVAVTEAVTNAIQHGNKYDPQKNVNVIVKTKDNLLRFVIQDEGPGFDFRNLPDPTDPDNIEKPHGRGIFLMQHLADTVDFKENGRTVELNFKMCAN